MITQISLKNVKSFKENFDVELSPFTLLIGDNGSGKSTYIQILSLLSQNSASMSLQDGQLASQGGYEQLANDNQKPIKIYLHGKLSLDAEGYNYLNDITYHLELQYNETNNNTVKTNCTIEASDAKEFLISKLGRTDKTLLSMGWDATVGQQPKLIKFYDEINNISFDVYVQFSGAFNMVVQSWRTAIDTDTQRRFGALLTNITTKLREEFENISYIPALRGIDSQTQSLLDHIQPHPVNAHNFNDQSNLLSSSFAYNRDLEEKISSLMKKIVNRKCRPMLRQGIVVSIETFNGDRWVNIMNEGFGANPLVQLVYQIVASPKNSLILIEEPEIHLYPAAQKRLLVELIKFAKSENKRLVITTHSPHLYATMSQFKENHDDEAKIYFFAIDSTTNTSRVEEVTSSNREGILREFLASDIGEIANMLEAAGI